MHTCNVCNWQTLRNVHLYLTKLHFTGVIKYVMKHIWESIYPSKRSQCSYGDSDAYILRLNVISVGPGLTSCEQHATEHRTHLNRFSFNRLSTMDRDLWHSHPSTFSLTPVSMEKRSNWRTLEETHKTSCTVHAMNTTHNCPSNSEFPSFNMTSNLKSWNAEVMEVERWKINMDWVTKKCSIRNFMMLDLCSAWDKYN